MNSGRQTAIVFGGGSKPEVSIPGAIVARLRNDDMDVVTFDIDFQRDQVEGSDFHCDVTNEEQVESCFQEAIKALGGRVDHVIYGVATSKRKPLWKLTGDQFRSTMNTCCFGAFYVLKQAALHMMPRKAGNIIVIGSSHGLLHGATPGDGDYNAGKTALNSLTLTLAAELYCFGIKVNIIQPGWVRTEAELNYHSKKRLDMAHKKLLPWGLGHPEQVAAMAAWLCSPESKFCTGGIFPVDGGHHLPGAFK